MGKIKDRVGEKHLNNQGCEFEIIEYFNCNNCTVQFEDGYISKNVHYSNIKRGSVKNLYHREVCGIGYIGEGIYKCRYKKELAKEYRTWADMLKRCYDRKELEKHPSYKDVIVCEEWHNFQNFAKWFEENYNPETMDGWHLDKDILVKGNKIYSPETCTFVPHEISMLFRKIKGNKYPTNISKKGKNFQVQLRKSNSNHYVGCFDSIEKAFQNSKIAKENHIKEMADKWCAKITKVCYQALYNYQVEITD